MRTNLIVSLVALLLIVGGAVTIYVTNTFGIQSEVTARTARAGIQVLEGEVHNRVLKEFGLPAEKTISLPITGILVDYAPAGYAITSSVENGSWSVVSLSDQKILAEGLQSKLWLSTSPNNRYLVYAERTALESNTEVPDALKVYDPTQWSIRLIDLQTGGLLSEVTGSMPRLFEREGSTYLLYLLPNEVRVRMLGTQKESVLPYQVDGLWPVEVSADGKYLALFNMDRMSYELFTFKLTNGSITLTPLPSMPVQVRILAFKGTDLYATAWFPEKEQAALVVIDLEHPETFTVLSDRPGLEKVRRIILAP